MPLIPISACSDWRLACLLPSPGEAVQPHRESEIAEIRETLVRLRGISAQDVADMLALINRARTILNPPGQSVHQVVMDADDLEFACERASASGAMTGPEIDAARALIRRHA